MVDLKLGPKGTFKGCVGSEISPLLVVWSIHELWVCLSPVFCMAPLLSHDVLINPAQSPPDVASLYHDLPAFRNMRQINLHSSYITQTCVFYGSHKNWAKTGTQVLNSSDVTPPRKAP